MKLILITGRDDVFIGQLIAKFHDICGVEFQDVIYWKRKRRPLENLKKNIKKHGFIYLPYRIGLACGKLLNSWVKGVIDRIFLAPPIVEDIERACQTRNIRVHEIEDIHSPEGVALVRELNADVMAVCGTGILRRSIFDLPRLGTINLHQGDALKYRGAPPGFWELWNSEPEVGVTIHFVDDGVDTGDIILQDSLPIFDYDTVPSVQAKLNEASLRLYESAIKQLVSGDYARIKQPQGVGKKYTYPTLYQSLRLYLKLIRHRFSIIEILRVKEIAYLISFCLLRFFNLARIKKNSGVLSVLYYHRVTNVCQDAMTLDIDEFERQIRFLKKNYWLISSNELLEWCDQAEFPMLAHRHACLITFDDGYEDNFVNALPILRKYQCPAIFFVSTGLIGNERQFPHDSQLQPRLAFRKMTWNNLKQAVEEDVEIGVHTETHADLGSVPYENAIQEIENSMRAYETQLGRPAMVMSYPFGGRHNITPAVREYVRGSRDIRLLFAAYGGLNLGSIDPYNIKRINVGTKDRGPIFWFKTENGSSMGRSSSQPK
ncbi:MAG: polysaccharide deacetylase family protein [Terriglobia bacterium]